MGGKRRRGSRRNAQFDAPSFLFFISPLLRGTHTELCAGGFLLLLLLEPRPFSYISLRDEGL